MGLQPRTARVVKDGREEDILIAELQVGDKVSVRPVSKFRWMESLSEETPL